MSTEDIESDLSSNASEPDDGVEEGSSSSDSEEQVEGGDAAEQEIEGDFDRLVQTIRSRESGGGNSAGPLTKDWDFNIAEQDAEFREDLRAASGIGKKRIKKGRSTGPVLSQQVRSLIGDGNQAYVDNDLPEAIRLMQEVIRIEPRAASAWSVLAQCYEDMKKDQKALQLRIMAAHLRHDSDEWDRLARQSRERGFTQQALYCYGKVASLDPNNVDALWDRASLAKEIGDLRTARTAFTAILKRFPHDLTVLAELRTILIELSDLSACANLFQQAFQHYQTLYPSGRGPDPSSHEEVAGGGFGQLEIFVLADLYNTVGEHERAIDVIRKGCRWLQGRSDQRFWDICVDDREYDLEDAEPRPESGQGVPEAGHYALDINARHRLAVARIKMGDIEEGKMHANEILAQDVLDYSPLFVEIADAYFDRELYADAKPIYEVLGTDAATSSLYVLLQTAECLRMTDDLRDAAEVYEHILTVDPFNNDAKLKLALVYEVLDQTWRALVLVHEVRDSRPKRRPKDSDGGSAQPEDGSGASDSLFIEGRPGGKQKSGKSIRLTPAQLRELEAKKESEVVRGYKRLKELWPLMMRQAGADGPEDAIKAWMIEAEALVETFRETRNLFLTSRTQFFRGMFPRSRTKKSEADAQVAEDRMVSRLQLDLASERDGASRGPTKSGGVTVFRGVSFDDWLKVIMQYCFLLTQRGQHQAADDILRHIMVSNAYQSRERQDSIRLALLTCAIATQDYPTVVEQARKIITAHQFNNEPLRILLASLCSGLRPTDSFITSTLQKHLFREIKVADVAVKAPETLKWNALNKRYAPTTAAGKVDADDDDPDDIVKNIAETQAPTNAKGSDAKPAFDLPKQQNPVPVTIYGQICIAAKSYQSAIFYLLHAYDYCPDDPMICLCLGIASIGRAMQRQSDNRHHLITQGMAFFSRYRELRGLDPKKMGEVEFNFGRAFQQLGLFSHAVKHYEHVLELAERHMAVEDPDRGLAREAAYNLSLIYVMTGAVPLAESLYRRWLSL